MKSIDKIISFSVSTVDIPIVVNNTRATTERPSGFEIWSNMPFTD